MFEMGRLSGEGTQAGSNEPEPGQKFGAAVRALWGQKWVLGWLPLDIPWWEFAAWRQSDADRLHERWSWVGLRRSRAR
jgi:hypothetical protein